MTGDWYRWVWGKWPRDSWDSENSASRKGQRCKLLAVGEMNAVVVEFEDGERFVTSRMGLRKLVR